MRTAIISDIHGNYPALMKVLEDARMEHVDKFIFLGDYYLDFPYANEVALELMAMENAYIIKGNREQIMKHYRERNPEDTINSRNAVIYHVIQEMTQETYDYLNDLEDELYIRLNPNTLVYATHVSPIYDKLLNNKCCNNISYAQAMLEKPFTHEEFLIDYHNFINSDICTPYIQNINANIILYGHNHYKVTHTAEIN